MRAKYDGTTYSFDVPDFPVNRCSDCGAATLDANSDEATNLALRQHLQLLLPAEIRANREALGLRQQDLAERLGCAAESVCRWETGAVIQSRSYDRMLRAFFHLPELRHFLDVLPGNDLLGRAVTLPASAFASTLGYPEFGQHALSGSVLIRCVPQVDVGGRGAPPWFAFNPRRPQLSFVPLVTGTPTTGTELKVA